MKISYDLRFANLPCGGRTYVQIIYALVKNHPDCHWVLYYNPWCSSQTEIVDKLSELYPSRVESGEICFVTVQAACLSLKHHIEFRKFNDDSDLYHYLHFDMPLGIKANRHLVTVHDLYPITLPGYCSSLKQLYFKSITRKSCQRSEKVIAISHHTKKDIIENLGIEESKIEVIHQGYSDRYGKVSDQQQLDQVKNKYQLPENFILYTGIHKPHKNLERLFQAYARLPKLQLDYFNLILTGPINQDTEKLKELAKSLGIESKVSFKGMLPIEDLPALYTLAKLFVLPSLYEGFGVPPLEAMACGTPVACSNATAIPEVVGNVGRLFNPTDIDHMADTISQALETDIDDSDLQKKCIEQAAKFSWEKTAKRTFQMYEKIVG